MYLGMSIVIDKLDSDLSINIDDHSLRVKMLI